MTEKWGKIQGKLDLVEVSGEFELSEFELSGLYCISCLVLYLSDTSIIPKHGNITHFKVLSPVVSVDTCHKLIHIKI